jgi:hypothetical protein
VKAKEKARERDSKGALPAEGRLKGASISILAAKERARGRGGKVVRPDKGRFREVSISILAEKGDARVRVKLGVPTQPRVALVKVQGLINTPEKAIEDAVKRAVVVLEPMHYREVINKLEDSKEGTIPVSR